MKQALISTNEPFFPINGKPGLRVAEVVEFDKTFEVHSDLYWIPCSDEVTSEHYYYVDGNFEFQEPPQEVVTPVETIGN